LFGREAVSFRRHPIAVVAQASSGFRARSGLGSRPFEPVEVVCRGTEKNRTHVRGGERPHNTVKRVGVFKGPTWHGGIVADIWRATNPKEASLKRAVPRNLVRK
jgi:hypothetical protein